MITKTHAKMSVFKIVEGITFLKEFPATFTPQNGVHNRIYTFDQRKVRDLKKLTQTQLDERGFKVHPVSIDLPWSSTSKDYGLFMVLLDEDIKTSLTGINEYGVMGCGPADYWKEGGVNKSLVHLSIDHYLFSVYRNNFQGYYSLSDENMRELDVVAHDETGEFEKKLAELKPMISKGVNSLQPEFIRFKSRTELILENPNMPLEKLNETSNS